MEKETLIYRKKDQRNISEFLGFELLYDYAIGALDAQTHKSMTEFLVQNKKAQEKLDKIYAGIKYTDRLAGFQIPKEIEKKIDIPAGYFETIVKQTNYSRWSNTMKWGAEAALVGVFVAVFVSFLPWERLYLPNAPRMSGQVVLSEVQRQASVPQDDNQVTIVPSTKEQVLYSDEETKEKVDAAKESAAALAKPEPVAKPEAVATAPEVKKPVAVAVATPTPVPAPLPTSVPQQVPTSTIVNETGKEVPSALTGAEKGFVYRASLKAPNLDADSLKIKERIEAIGGRKAGQVPLGWKRPGGSYFHFTIPENQFKEMENILLPYGKIKISRDPHPRVMPKGIIRFILWVEDVNTEGMSHEE